MKKNKFIKWLSSFFIPHKLITINSKIIVDGKEVTDEEEKEIVIEMMDKLTREMSEAFSDFNNMFKPNSK